MICKKFHFQFVGINSNRSNKLTDKYSDGMIRIIAMRDNNGVITDINKLQIMEKKIKRKKERLMAKHRELKQGEIKERTKEKFCSEARQYSLDSA